MRTEGQTDMCDEELLVFATMTEEALSFILTIMVDGKALIG
jgi:hypothetical protein